MKLAIKYGVLVGLGSFAWIMAEYFLGFRTTHFGTHLTTSLFAVVVLALGVALAIGYRRQQLGSRFTFGSGFWTGLGVSLVAGLVMVAGQYLYLQVVDPTYLDRAEAWSTYVQVLDGTPFETAKANTANDSWKYNANVRAFGQVPYFLVQGAVVSGIISLVATKKRR